MKLRGCAVQGGLDGTIEMAGCSEVVSTYCLPPSLLRALPHVYIVSFFIDQSTHELLTWFLLVNRSGMFSDDEKYSLLQSPITECLMQ